MTDTQDEARTPESDRLKAARERAGFDSAMAAAKHFGWTSSTYGAHENGRNGFGAAAAQKYAAAFGVRWGWLLTGAGDMVLEGATPLASPVIGVPPALLRPTGSAPNAGRRVTGFSAPAPGLIPILGRAAAGEPGKIILLGEVNEWIPCPPELIGVDGGYATYVHGDSMIPRYFHNERVYVHPTRPVGKGDFVVAQVMDEQDDHSGYVKQLDSWNREKLVLHQYNPDTNLDFDADDVEAVHLIVGSGRG